MKFGKSGTGNGEFNTPLELAIDSSDNIFVVDQGNNRVQVFNRDGGYITQFGNQGQVAEILQGPVGITIDSNDNVYIADGMDSDIHVFSQVK
jgi:DNA-binding beta-propeller fold protein YncE